MYVLKFEGTAKAPPNTSLIPGVKDDVIARILSILFAIEAFFDFLHLVYSWSFFYHRIGYFGLFMVTSRCMCFLASGVVKSRQSHIIVALKCQFLVMVWYAFWFVVVVISWFSDIVDGWSFHCYYSFWCWVHFTWWMLWMVLRFLLLFLLWRLHKLYMRQKAKLHEYTKLRKILLTMEIKCPPGGIQNVPPAVIHTLCDHDDNTEDQRKRLDTDCDVHIPGEICYFSCIHEIFNFVENAISNTAEKVLPVFVLNAHGGMKAGSQYVLTAQPMDKQLDLCKKCFVMSKETNKWTQRREKFLLNDVIRKLDTFERRILLLALICRTKDGDDNDANGTDDAYSTRNVTLVYGGSEGHVYFEGYDRDFARFAMRQALCLPLEKALKFLDGKELPDYVEKGEVKKRSPMSVAKLRPTQTEFCA